MDKTSLGDRMKQYERNHKYYLIKKVPVIVRIDGRAFHSLKLDKPYDLNFYDCKRKIKGFNEGKYFLEFCQDYEHLICISTGDCNYILKEVGE